MKRLMAVVTAAFMLLAPASALAFNSGDNPGGTGSNTITWTGQGSENVNDAHCNGDTPNPGDTLFIFTTDGGSAHDAQLFVNGGSAIDPAEGNSGGSQFHFYTNLDSLDGLSAYATFVVDDAGSGAWNLVISHGCPGEAPEADAPTVTKTAVGSYDNSYTWDITKVVDQTSVETLPGGSVTLNYTVTVSHDGGTIDNVAVTGTITVTNPNDESITLDSITDTLSDDTACDVDTSEGLELPSGDTDFAYSCDLDAVPAGELTNHVEIAWSDQTLADDSELAAATAEFDSGVISFDENTVDECVDVEDTYSGGPDTTLCVGDAGDVAGTFTLNYQRTVNAPALGTCVDVDNTASFTTNDTETYGEDSATSHICTFRAPLTIGYWRNHLAPISASCKSSAGCSANGPWTRDLLGTTICGGNCVAGKLSGGYTVTTIAQAKAVFDANNCSNASTSNSNAAACLAAQLLGAELNVANVANSCICDTIHDAKALLTAVGYTGPGHAVNFTGSGYTRADAIALKTALDNYNNGLGCPSS
jgi:hypothetical protein